MSEEFRAKDEIPSSIQIKRNSPDISQPNDQKDIIRSKENKDNEKNSLIQDDLNKGSQSCNRNRPNNWKIDSLVFNLDNLPVTIKNPNYGEESKKILLPKIHDDNITNAKNIENTTNISNSKNFNKEEEKEEEKGKVKTNFSKMHKIGIKNKPLKRVARISVSDHLLSYEDPEDVIKELEKQEFSQLPKIIQKLNSIAENESSKNNFLKAIRFYEKIISLDKENGPAYTALGHCYLIVENLEMAFETYQKALFCLNDINDAQLWYGIALLYEKYEAYEHAIPSYLSVLNIQNSKIKKSEIYFKIGNILFQTCYFDKAIDFFKAALKEEESREAIYKNSYNMKDLKYITNMTNITNITNITNFINLKIEILNKIGLTYQEKSDYNLAVQAFQEALNFDNSQVQAYEFLAWNQFLAKKYDESEKTIQNVFNFDSTDCDSYYIKARCLIEKQQFKESIDCIIESIKINPNNAIFHCTLGFAQAKIKDYQAAFLSFVCSSKIEITIPETWFNLGILYEICHQPKESIFVLEKSLIHNPDFEKSKERIKYLESLQNSQNPQNLKGLLQDLKGIQGIQSVQGLHSLQGYQGCQGLQVLQLQTFMQNSEEELIQLMLLPEYSVGDTIKFKPQKKYLTNERLKYVVENEMSFIGSLPNHNLFELYIQPSNKNENSENPGNPENSENHENPEYQENLENSSKFEKEGESYSQKKQRSSDIPELNYIPDLRAEHYENDINNQNSNINNLNNNNLMKTPIPFDQSNANANINPNEPKEPKEPKEQEPKEPNKLKELKEPKELQELVPKHSGSSDLKMNYSFPHENKKEDKDNEENQKIIYENKNQKQNINININSNNINSEKVAEKVLPILQKGDEKLQNIKINNLPNNLNQSQFKSKEQGAKEISQNEEWNPINPFTPRLHLQPSFLNPRSNPNLANQINSYYPVLPAEYSSFYCQPRFISQPFNPQMCLNLAQLNPQQQMINRSNQQFVYPLMPPKFLNTQIFSNQMVAPYSYQYPTQTNPQINFNFMNPPPLYNGANNPTDNIFQSSNIMNPNPNFHPNPNPNSGLVEEKNENERLKRRLKSPIKTNSEKKNFGKRKIKEKNKNEESGVHEMIQHSNINPINPINPINVSNQKVENLDNLNRKNSTVVKINLNIDQSHKKIKSQVYEFKKEIGKDNEISIQKKRKKRDEDLNLNIEKHQKK